MISLVSSTVGAVMQGIDRAPGWAFIVLAAVVAGLVYASAPRSER